MAISGAIFDVDGTLVDSMPTWRGVWEPLYKEHGVKDGGEVFDAIESLDTRDKCRYLHENFGMGQSVEGLFDWLITEVCHAYRTSIPAWPGCVDFVRGLHEAGIPLAIASSTPRVGIETVLLAHGITDCFRGIVTTDDVGCGKDRPDVYLAALEILGSPLEETWVFEDAPFGILTPHAAGFHTVCVHNDHDGRDEAELGAVSDILVHADYRELSIDMLRNWEDRK